MMRNLVTSLFVHERITTTDMKAKELRRVAERLVTKAARVSSLATQAPGRLSQSDRARLVHARRVVARHLRAWATDREDNEVDVLWKLFSVLGPRFAERNGGYTRIVKLPNLRKGDSAPLSIVEFVDFEEAAAATADGESAATEDGPAKKKGLLGGLFGRKPKKAPAPAARDEENEDDDEDDDEDEEDEKK
jgi:large subunit ribosomal protein L17